MVSTLLAICVSNKACKATRIVTSFILFGYDLDVAREWLMTKLAEVDSDISKCSVVFLIFTVAFTFILVCLLNKKSGKCWVI